MNNEEIDKLILLPINYSKFIDLEGVTPDIINDGIHIEITAIMTNPKLINKMRSSISTGT